MAATFARFTQLLTIEFPYQRRSMGPMRLYMLACLSGSGLASKPVMSQSFPTNMAEKHGGDFHAFYPAYDDRISLPEA